MLRNSFTLLFFVVFVCSKAQNPANISISSPPPNLAVDTYTRATVKINLQPGFKYGFTGSGATNFLNLSISSYSSNLINSNYIDPSLNVFGGFNPNLVLGSTEGNYNVSPTGQFLFNLPIACSPGTNDVKPSLSVAYNSFGYNGLMGIGFNLSGISTISRVGYDRFHDGISTGVNLTTTDQFAIDGNRLFLNSGTHGQDGSTYILQAINHQTIISHGTSGNGPLFFEVIQPNGYTIEYGNTPGSRLVANGDLTVLSWYVNKVKDEFGNYMTYSYSCIDGEVLIDKIEYTGNAIANLMPYNKIKFDYVDRSDKNTIYVSGKAFNSTKLLKSITSSDINNELVHKYVFDYNFNVYSLLYKITEVDADGNQLNPSIFNWDNPDKGNAPLFNEPPYFDNMITSGYVNNVKTVMAPDLNGDGYGDLVAIASNDGFQQYSQNPTLIPHTYTDVEVYAKAEINNMKKGQVNDPSGNITFISGGQLALISPISYSMHAGAFIIDPDKDGRQALAVISQHTTNPSAQYNVNCTYKVNEIRLMGSTIMTPNTYNSGSKWCYYIPAENSINHSTPSCFFYDVNDYNNDGVDDRLIIDQFTFGFLKGIPSSIGGGFAPEVNHAINFSGAGFAGFFVKIGDYDGDGSPDLYLIQNPSPLNYSGPNNYKYFVYKVNNAGTAFTLLYSSPTITKAASSTSRLCLKTFDVGDFNGDGKTDVFSTGEANGETKVYLSTGTGFISKVLDIPYFNASDDLLLTANDLNGDNKSDITIKKFTAYDSNGLPTSSVYKNYFSFGQNVLNDNSNFVQNDKVYTSTFGDFNADGNVDYFGADYSTGSQFIRFNNLSMQKKYFLREVLSPKRTLKINYAYSRSSYDYNFFSPNSQWLYKVYERNDFYTIKEPSIYLVSEITDNNKSIRYCYFNSIFNDIIYPGKNYAGGGQFMGFEKTIAAIRDLTTGPSPQFVGSSTTYNYDKNINALVGSETITGKFNLIGTNYLGGNSVIINSLGTFFPKKVLNMTSQMTKSSTQNVNVLAATQINNSKIYYNTQSISTNKNYLNSTNNTAVIQFDNNKQGNVVSNVNTSFQWGTSNAIKTITTLNTYTLLTNGKYKLHLSQMSSQQVNEPVYVRETKFDYDNAWHLAFKTSEPNQSQLTVVTKYEQFNSFGNPTKFTISASDISPRTVSQVYDPTGRFMIQKTNSANNIENFLYEPKFGKLIQTIDITGLVTKIKYDGLGKLIETKLPNNAINKVEYKWDNSIAFNGSYIVETTEQDHPKSIQYFDKNDNLLKTESEGFNGNVIVSTNTYDGWNRLIVSTEPHFANQVNYKLSKIDYNDPYYRQKNVSDYVYTGGDTYVGGKEYYYNTISTDQNYNKGSIKVTSLHAQTNNNIQSVLKENNEVGQVTTISNFDGGQPQKISNYTFHSNGEAKAINLSFPDGATGVTTFQYDNLGRQSAIIDQSSGTTSYQYNSIGEIVQQSTANGVFNIVYDQIGRKISKTGSASGTTYYQYVTSGNGLQQVQQITGPNSTTEVKYDNLNRIIEEKETIGNKVLKTTYTYDSFGKLLSYTFPNNYSVNYVYDNIGKLTQIKNGNLVIWQLNSEFAPGLINQYSYNNNSKLTTINYNPNTYNLYRINDKIQTNDYSQFYNYDFSGTHNITSRGRNQDYLGNSSKSEQFDYDAVERLNKVSETIGQTTNILQTIAYKYNGNISYKTDAGTYAYSDVNKPYQLTHIINPTNNISLNTLNITYNDFNKVSQINEMGSPNKQMNFIYGNDDERIKVDYVDGTNDYTRYYASAYEREETTNSYKEWNYIFGPTGLAAINFNSNGNQQLLYVTTDHLGSPLLLTNSAGQVVEEYSFDAWGRRRNPANWTYTGFATPQYLRRGFTFHEHIDEFGLINMNGRIYDPVIGRFIQPDKLVQSPDNLQNFNRYSYVYNNPLKYTDPTGNWTGWDDVAVIGVGFGYGYISYGIKNDDWGKNAAVNGLMYGALFELGYLTGGGGLVAGGSMDAAMSYLLSTGVNMFMAQVVPSATLYESENFDVTASAMFGYGSSGATFGLAVDAEATVDNFTFGFRQGFGYNRGLSDLSGKAGAHYYSFTGLDAEVVLKSTSYGIGVSRSNFMGGNTDQGVAAVRIQIGDFSARLDEDFIWDHEDRYRTGGLLLTYKLNKDITLAFGGSMLTGDANSSYDSGGGVMVYNPNDEEEQNRGGIMYGGVIYKNQAYFIGHNSERRLHRIQNWIHKDWFDPDIPFFEDLNYRSKAYGYYGTYNRNYLYY